MLEMPSLSWKGWEERKVGRWQWQVAGGEGRGKGWGGGRGQCVAGKKFPRERESPPIINYITPSERASLPIDHCPFFTARHKSSCSLRFMGDLDDGHKCVCPSESCAAKGWGGAQVGQGLPVTHTTNGVGRVAAAVDIFFSDIGAREITTQRLRG